MFKTLIRIFIPTVFAGLLLASTANAAAVQIQCPVNQIETGVITPLPQEWYFYPTTASLVSVEVSHGNGETYLSCGYQTQTGVVFVHSVAPPGDDCMAEGSGFVCTSAGVVAPGRATYLTGDINVPQSYTMDLDNGSLGGGGADIWYNAENSIVRYLEPINGASMAVSGYSPIGFDGCDNLGRFSRNTIEMHNLPEGIYVCVRTSEGRVSEFRVNVAVTDFNDELSVGFTTFD